MKSKKRECFDPKITSKEKKILYKLIDIISKILKKHDIKWIPIGGNLLAIYRHNSLLIPWNNDYNIVVEEKKVKTALDILEKELPKYEAKIVYFRRWDYPKGKLYKIFFKPNHSKYKNSIVSFKKYTHTWPFVDLFVNCKKDFKQHVSQYAHNILPDEKLKSIKINGIQTYVPVNGERNLEVYKRTSMLNKCVAQSYMHKFEKSVKCYGKKQASWGEGCCTKKGCKTRKTKKNKNS